LRGISDADIERRSSNPKIREAMCNEDLGRETPLGKGLPRLPGNRYNPLRDKKKITKRLQE